MTTIDPTLIDAYMETEYHVFGDKGFIITIGSLNPELLAAHLQNGVSCSAFITPCNPYSQSLTAEQNKVLLAALSKELIEKELQFVHGIGQHPSNGWPGEESFLIFGLDGDAAKALGCRLGQNAIVWSGADAIPELVLLG